MFTELKNSSWIQIIFLISKEWIFLNFNEFFLFLWTLFWEISNNNEHLFCIWRTKFELNEHVLTWWTKSVLKYIFFKKWINKFWIQRTYFEFDEHFLKIYEQNLKFDEHFCNSMNQSWILLTIFKIYEQNLNYFKKFLDEHFLNLVNKKCHEFEKQIRKKYAISKNINDFKNCSQFAKIFTNSKDICKFETQNITENIHKFKWFSQIKKWS